jgi:hypothetical protein
MAHFSVTENIWIPDGQAAALATKTSATPVFWPHTNTWVTGTVTQPTIAADAVGPARYCKRLNSYTKGIC